MRPGRTITKSSDFRRLYASAGRARRDGLTVYVAPRAGSGSDDSTRLGVAVGAGPGGAVVRNRVKRRLRAAARASLPATGLDVIVRADRTVARLPFQELTNHLDAAVADARGDRT